ncbi:MAG: hypothetical protein E4G96_09935 [Chrysiogenales bacterium]|nr:MAG: hypothetical protein E4G96_09935 [Chrysiogenales bacterium]
MLLFLAIAVVNLVGTHHLDITSERLSYYIRIFGKKIVNRVMDSASIGLIKNSIGGPEDRIQVMSSRGLVAVRKISEKIKGDTSKSPDMSIVGELLSLKDDYIDIPVKSLSLAEKLFIENMILRRIPVSG